MRFIRGVAGSTVTAASVVLLSACGGSPASPAAGTSEGGRYVTAIIDTMQAHSLNRYKIDWTSFRAQVLGTVPAKAQVSDSFTAILLAFELLGDSHSYYRAAAGQAIGAYALDCSAPAVGAVPPIGPDIGYVHVSTFGGSGAAATAYTDSIQSIIRATDSQQLRGWIVDLRGDAGGNMYPMIAGIGPILGTGIAGYFVDPDGQATRWGYDGGAAFLEGNDVQATTIAYTLLSPSPPAAVLLDRAVASSGEAVAVAFKKRPNTRFFGASTCGLSTGVAGYPLSDGATLFLATVTMADRASNPYGGAIAPDDALSDTAAVVPAAVTWLRANASAGALAHLSGSRPVVR